MLINVFAISLTPQFPWPATVALLAGPCRTVEQSREAILHAATATASLCLSVASRFARFRSSGSGTTTDLAALLVRLLRGPDRLEGPGDGPPVGAK
jgi:hypothetical protein